MSTVVSPSASPALATISPTTSVRLPDHLANPTRKVDLLEKLELVKKTSNNEIKRALSVIETVVRTTVVEDYLEEQNVGFYNRLTDQVICGTRTYTTLGMPIGSVRGINPELLRDQQWIEFPPAPTIEYSTADGAGRQAHKPGDVSHRFRR